MLTWCMAHPYMTFMIVVLMIVSIDICVDAIAGAIIGKKKDGLEDN